MFTYQGSVLKFRLICGMNEGFPSQGLICFVCDFTIRTHWTHCEFLPVWSTRTFKFQEHKWSLCLVEKRCSLEMIDSWLGLYGLTFDVIFWGKSLNLPSASNTIVLCTAVQQLEHIHKVHAMFAVLILLLTKPGAQCYVIPYINRPTLRLWRFHVKPVFKIPWHNVPNVTTSWCF